MGAFAVFELQAATAAAAASTSQRDARTDLSYLDDSRGDRLDPTDTVGAAFRRPDA
jgi:hypothetical protein